MSETYPKGTSTLGTQQVVPVTELWEMITEVVKEVLTGLRAGNRNSDESNTRGR